MFAKKFLVIFFFYNFILASGQNVHYIPIKSNGETLDFDVALFYQSSKKEKLNSLTNYLDLLESENKNIVLGDRVNKANWFMNFLIEQKSSANNDFNLNEQEQVQGLINKTCALAEKSESIISESLPFASSLSDLKREACCTAKVKAITVVVIVAVGCLAGLFVYFANK